MDTIQGYITLAKAAEELGYSSRSTLTTLARKKRIEGAVKVGNLWLLPLEWVEAEKKKEIGAGKGWKRGKSLAE